MLKHSITRSSNYIIFDLKICFSQQRKTVRKIYSGINLWFHKKGERTFRNSSLPEIICDVYRQCDLPVDLAFKLINSRDQVLFNVFDTAAELIFRHVYIDVR